jgi:hypothetical protein
MNIRVSVFAAWRAAWLCVACWTERRVNRVKKEQSFPSPFQINENNAQTVLQEMDLFLHFASFGVEPHIQLHRQDALDGARQGDGSSRQAKVQAGQSVTVDFRTDRGESVAPPMPNAIPREDRVQPSGQFPVLSRKVRGS